MSRSSRSRRFPVISSHTLPPEKRFQQLQLEIVALTVELQLDEPSDRSDLIRAGNRFLSELREAVNRIAPGKLRAS